MKYVLLICGFICAALYAGAFVLVSILTDLSNGQQVAIVVVGCLASVNAYMCLTEAFRRFKRDRERRAKLTVNTLYGKVADVVSKVKREQGLGKRSEFPKVLPFVPGQDMSPITQREFDSGLLDRMYEVNPALAAEVERGRERRRKRNEEDE